MDSKQNEPTERDPLKETQQKVDAVVNIMHTNLDMAIQRQGNLEQLESKSENITRGAELFGEKATKMKKKYWWKNMKMMIIIGAICTLLVIIIICCIVF